LTNRQPNNQTTPLHQHQQKQPPQLQKARRIPTPSLGLASVIDVKSGHKSNECPKEKQVNMVDYEDDEEEGFEIEKRNDFDFADEHREFGTCVAQRLLCNQKAPDTTQRHQIFYSRCSVKSKVCNLIIDNGSCENIF